MELLVVVAIIGILAAIVTTSLGGAKGKSRDARRISDIKNIQLALSLYYNDNLMYPKNLYASSAGTAPNNGLLGGYLPTIPTDPNQSGSCTAGTEAACYKYVALTSSASPTCNATTNIPNKYHIGAILEETGNAELNKDVDAPLQSTASTGYTPCTASGSGDFNGLTATCTAGANGTDGCYDLTP